MGASVFVLGDIHVSVRGQVPSVLSRIVAYLVLHKPAAVVLLGDAVSGNKNDGHSLATVRMWWQALWDVLAPLAQAGIPILPIAGNHDVYTGPQKEGFAEAFARLRGHQQGTEVPPVYQHQVGGADLFLAHVVDQHLTQPVAAALGAGLAASSSPLRLVFGHVPLASAMGKTSESFQRQMVSLLSKGRVAAYFSGHEHLYWDGSITTEDGTLRQIIVGTPGASYVYPVKESLRKRYAQGDSLVLPATGDVVALVPQSGEERHRVCFAELHIEDATFVVRPLAVDDDGAIMDLDERKTLRWLRNGLVQLHLGKASDFDDDPVAEPGRATTTAIRAFQKQVGLEEDGVAGPKTRALLRIRLAAHSGGVVA